MIFVKTFKGYEDKTPQLDSKVNEWIQENSIEVVDIKAVLAHEPSARTQAGDVLYSVLYRSEMPVSN